jgi:N-acyl-L-homoserine lactone synthetase
MPTDTWMHFDARGSLREAARDCEAEVFSKWFGNTREQLEEEYGPYEDSSVFLVLADRHGQVVGEVRLIAPGGRAGLKTLVDVGRAPWGVNGARAAAAVGMDPRSTWEIATLGVRDGTEAMGKQLSLALYHGLITVARVNQMSSFVATLDERVRRLLGSVGILTRALPGTATAPYLGSAASTPVYAHCAPLLDNQRRQFADAYRLVTLGVGLDGVAVPTLDSFRLRPHPDDGTELAC